MKRYLYKRMAALYINMTTGIRTRLLRPNMHGRAALCFRWFHHRHPSLSQGLLCVSSRRHASVKAVEQPSQAAVPPDRFQVIEVFTPPRLAKLAVTKGVNSLTVTADRITGWDFRRPADRQRLLDIVRQHRPELLFIGPPCTWIGGWFDVDSPHLDAEQRAERSRLIKLLYGFVADVAQIQLANGGHLVLEPSAELAFWKMPRLAALKSRLFEVSVDLCAYGLALSSAEACCISCVTLQHALLEPILSGTRATRASRREPFPVWFGCPVC